jgi:hypothetical protein
MASGKLYYYSAENSWGAGDMRDMYAWTTEVVNDVKQKAAC